MLAPSFARWLDWLRLRRDPCYTSIICSRRATTHVARLPPPSCLYIHHTRGQQQIASLCGGYNYDSTAMRLRYDHFDEST